MVMVEGKRCLAWRGHRRLEQFTLKRATETSQIEICYLFIEAVQCGPRRGHSGGVEACRNVSYILFVLSFSPKRLRNSGRVSLGTYRHHCQSYHLAG